MAAFSAVEGLLDELLHDACVGDGKRPDAAAMRALQALCDRCPRAAKYAIHEISTNIGVGLPGGCGKFVDDYRLTGRHDGEGAVWEQINDLSGRPCPLRDQPASKYSAALMGIVTRWHARLDNPANQALLAAPQRLPTPTKKRPRSPDLASPSSPRWLQQQSERVIEILLEQKDGAKGVAFELRFRLEANGTPWLNVLHSPELLEKVQKLHADYKADSCRANARALNRRCVELGLPDLGFLNLADEHELVYECELQRRDDADPNHPTAIKCLPPSVGNSHAHRKLARHYAGGEVHHQHGKLLRVRFAPLPAGQRHDEQQKRIHCVWMSGVLRNGFQLCGRHYMHFCHKDADKQSRQVWFVACDGKTIQRYLDNGHQSVHVTREKLLDVCDPKLKVPKLAARLGLAFSPALPLCDVVGGRLATKWKIVDLRSLGPDAYRAADVDANPGGLTLLLVDDVNGHTPDGAVAVDPSTGKARIMTDGDGLIARDVASLIPATHSGRLRQQRPADRRTGIALGAAGAPSWTQVRLWFRGSVAKGGLSLDATLPDGHIVLRDSMVKVNSTSQWPTLQRRVAEAQPTRTPGRPPQAFEVLRTSNPPAVGRLSPQLVPLLEHGGGDLMVRLLLQLQREQIETVLALQEISGASDERRWQRLLREMGMRPAVEGVAATPADMLLAGFCPQSEPYLRQKVIDMVSHSLDDLARGRLTLEGSINLPGRPDPTNSLLPNTIVVYHLGSSFEDDVLVYRNPGVAAGDLRKARAVSPPPALAATLDGADPLLANCVIFSTQGERAMADTLSGGGIAVGTRSLAFRRSLLKEQRSSPCGEDYDGDEFLIMRGAVKIVLPPAEVQKSRPPPPVGGDPGEQAAGIGHDRRDSAESGSSSSQQSAPVENCCVAGGGLALSLVDAFVSESPPYEAPLPQPGAQAAAPAVLDRAVEAGCAMRDHLLDRLAASSKIGRAANLIMAAQEHWGVDSPQVHRLIATYYAALDEGKSGEAATLPRELEAEIDRRGWPAHLQSKLKPGAGGTRLVDEHVSTSALGRMWRARYGYGTVQEMDAAVELDEDLRVPLSEFDDEAQEFYDTWRTRVIDYCRKMVDLKKLEKKGVEWGEGGDKKEAAQRWRHEYRSLVQEYREKLLSKYSSAARELNVLRVKDSGELRRLLRECQMLAKAVYDRSSERAGRASAGERASGLAFAWNVAGDYLCYIKETTTRAGEGRPAKAVNAELLCAAIAGGRGGRRAVNAEPEDDAGANADAEEVNLAELSSCC